MDQNPKSAERLFVTLPKGEAEHYQAVSEDVIRAAIAEGKAERDAVEADISTAIAPSNLLFR